MQNNHGILYALNQLKKAKREIVFRIQINQKQLKSVRDAITFLERGDKLQNKSLNSATETLPPEK